MKYIVYDDQNSLAIISEPDYDELKAVCAALCSTTWGEFMDSLPSRERERVLQLWGTEVFGSDFVPWDDPEEEAEARDDLVYRDTPFDVQQVPGISDGDYPFWPRNYWQIKDPVCIAVYEAFGKKEFGFIQTMYTMPRDAAPAIKEWLEAHGHTMEVRDAPDRAF